MKDISFNLSGKIDQQIAEIASTVKEHADSLGIQFFVVGALARDIILQYIYGIVIKRATRDIDLGIKVDNWEQFNQLKKSLIATGKFTPDRKPQRLYFNNVPIDILPFGPITDERMRILWPPEQEVFMSMVGFKEAYEYSITVMLRSAPELKIKVPTLPGLAIMKIISWNEKYPERKRDAADLLLIMQKYEEAGNVERLYDEEQAMLTEEDFGITYACIRLLGRDISKIADPETLDEIKTMLEGETKEQSQYRLIIDMLGGSFNPDDNKFDEILSQVKKLKTGIEEVVNKSKYRQPKKQPEG